MLIPIQEKINKINNWLCFNSSGYPYLIGVGIKQWTSGVKKNYPTIDFISLCGIRYTKEGSELQYFASNDEYKDSANYLFDNLDVLEKLYQDFCKYEKEFIELEKMIQQNGDQYLHENYKKFIDIYDNEYIAGAIIDGFLIFSENLFLDLRNKYADYKYEMEELVQPYGATFNSREQLSLHNIALKVKLNKNILINELLKEHQTNFHWIQNNYKNIEGLPVAYFKEKLEELLKKSEEEIKEEITAISNQAIHHQEKCEEIERMGIFEKGDYEKLLWLGKIAWWVDRRKEYNLKANYYIGRYLKILAKEKGFKYNDIVYLFPWEVEKILSRESSIGDYSIENRKGDWLHFYDTEDQEVFLTGIEEQQFLDKALSKVEEGVKEFKGMIANRGLVKGIVRVIMDAHNAKEFNLGDILVTGMTRPDFLGLMKKAAAFVTDEGGITCHAAIVSRELNKPCIIGTKIATRVLKDGDLVEIDAQQGTVKILN